MSFFQCCTWVCLVRAWFVEACGEAQYAVSVLTTSGSIGPVSNLKWNVHHRLHTFTAPLFAQRVLWPCYLTAAAAVNILHPGETEREREREEERGCKLGIGERRGFGAEVNNWKNLSPGGIYSSPVVGRRGDVCWEGSSLNGMPKGERRGGEWVRGRSCKKIWNWRAVVGGDLKGYLQARRGPRGGQRGNHWRQSKGVPRTQKINQSFSTSYVQLVWLYFFLSTFESSEAQLLSP